MIRPPDLTSQQAMQILGLPPATFWRVIRNNKDVVTPIRYSWRCVRFDSREIERLREKARITTTAGLLSLVDGRRKGA